MRMHFYAAALLAAYADRAVGVYAAARALILLFANNRGCYLRHLNNTLFGYYGLLFC